MVRTDMKTGEITVLTDKFAGKRYNAPNDVCVDTKGRIWFTDPYYGPDRGHLEMDIDGVYASLNFPSALIDRPTVPSETSTDVRVRSGANDPSAFWTTGLR